MATVQVVQFERMPAVGAFMYEVFSQSSQEYIYTNNITHAS